MNVKIDRKQTRTIRLGSLLIGGNNPISIQSMTNTCTADEKGTIAQIRKLEKIGCEIIRVAVPDPAAVKAIRKIKTGIHIPLVADIHFDYKLALAAIEAGVDGLRLNPGNIGSQLNVLKVVDAAREKKIPIRIGVNSGSLSKKILHRYGVTAQGLVESALEHVHILEKAGYEEMKISVKTSSVPLTIEAYRLLSTRINYPLHLGVTEAGTEFSGTINSAVGIGTLLAEGIGDTIRVSLTADPSREIPAARQILQALNLRKGLRIISCPTCGRTEINLISLTKEAEKKLAEFSHLDLTVAVMGCVVNGPGEARKADFGIAGGKKEGLLFKRGQIVGKVPESQLLEELLKLIKADVEA